MLRHILITGANRGLGKGLAEMLCQKQHNPLNLGILVSSRDRQKGIDTVYELRHKYPKSNLQHIELEVGNEESHKELGKRLKKEEIKLSVLVNNAGIFDKQVPKEISAEESSKRTFDTNYFGGKWLTQSLYKHMTDDAKIIFYGAAMLGKVGAQTKYIQEKLNDVVYDWQFDDLADEYIETAKQQSFSGKTFKKDTSYHLSKALIQQWVNLFGQYEIQPKQNMFIICPGWCKTDMGTQQASKSIEEGVSYPLELINGFPYERSERTGLLYSYNKQMPL